MISIIMKKIKKVFILPNTKKKLFIINAGQPAGRAKKVNPILNCGAGQNGSD